MIKVYTTPTCPTCFVLEQFLKERDIEFEEIDVSANEKIRNELIKKTEKMEIPVIEINGQFIEGFDKKKICKLLNINE